MHLELWCVSFAGPEVVRVSEVVPVRPCAVHA